MYVLAVCEEGMESVTVSVLAQNDYYLDATSLHYLEPLWRCVYTGSMERSNGECDSVKAVLAQNYHQVIIWMQQACTIWSLWRCVLAIYEKVMESVTVSTHFN